MPSTTAANAALVRRFLTDVVSGGDVDAVDGFLATDLDHHNLAFDDSVHREGVTALGWRVLAGAEVSLGIDDVVAADDRVAVRATVTGTHRESLVDLAPTGRTFEIPYVWFCRVEDGRIAEIWSLPDALGLLEAIRALPESDRTGPSSARTDTEHP